MSLKVVALAGGVGGAKLAHGLAQLLISDQLTIVVNTGDDFTHFGLHISPDLDTVMYTLADVANPETGWGQRGETWNFMQAVERVGGPTWFNLGDKDLATHAERTRRLKAGETLTQATAALCAAFGVLPKILPMTDAPAPTKVITNEGPLEFQDYFVRRRCEPRVQTIVLTSQRARPTPQVLEALARADVVILCPSNPFLSLDPILHLRGLRRALKEKRVVAVSPIVGGQAIKGPAAKLMAELELDVSATSVARHYANILTGFVLDEVDAALKPDVEALVKRVHVTDTIMRSTADRLKLAHIVLDFAKT